MRASDADSPVTPTTMRAVVQDEYGKDAADVLRLEQIDRPEIGDEEVLVRVRAASVHIGDWHVMSGLPYLLRVVGLRPPCTEGFVSAAWMSPERLRRSAQNVTRFKAGDEVFGTCNGSFADYAATAQDTLAAKPANLTFEQAAAVPTSGRRRPAGPAGRRRASRPGQRVLLVGRLRRRGPVRGADRQSSRRRRDRCLQYREGGPGPLGRRRPRHRLHPRRLHHKQPAVRPGPRHGRQPFPVAAQARPAPRRNPGTRSAAKRAIGGSAAGVGSKPCCCHASCPACGRSSRTRIRRICRRSPNSSRPARSRPSSTRLIRWSESLRRSAISQPGTPEERSSSPCERGSRPEPRSSPREQPNAPVRPTTRKSPLTTGMTP